MYKYIIHYTKYNTISSKTFLLNLFLRFLEVYCKFQS